MELILLCMQKWTLYTYMHIRNSSGTVMSSMFWAQNVFLIIVHKAVTPWLIESIVPFGEVPSIWIDYLGVLQVVGVFVNVWQ